MVSSNRLIGQVDTLAKRLPKDLSKINGIGKPEPKIFSIDEKTGSINGLPFLKLILNRDLVTDSINNLVINKKINTFLNSSKVKNKTNNEINFGKISPDNKYYITGFEDVSGLYSLFFFNASGELLNKFIFDNGFIAYGDFNRSGTFYMVFGEFSGDYYFFTLDGKLVRSGNYNKTTGDKGTSYSQGDISTTGKTWLLSNNYTFLYDNNEKLIEKLPAIDYFLMDESKNKLIYTKDRQIYIYNYKNKEVEYVSNRLDINVLNIEKGILNIRFNVNKEILYSYEIKL
ncbi:MAG TPA: hypothetical protein VK590_12670 [Saprospiraceae bacterium]|nr:hypothetical protein [Saprospiraceae bacterium]